MREKSPMVSARIAVVLAAALALAGGCSKPCQLTDPATPCQGSSYSWCGPTSDDDATPKWYTVNCDVLCVNATLDGSNVPFCALSKQPIAACATAGSACFNNAVVGCENGYPTPGDGDGTCPSGQQCVDDGVDSPVCGTPDSRCTATSEICDGTTIIACTSAYNVFEMTCPDACVALLADGVSSAFCALSSQRDPSCDLTYDSVYCDGAVGVQCEYGYPIDRQTCDVGQTCSVGVNMTIDCMP
jgi:hypothetical protein